MARPPSARIAVTRVLALVALFLSAAGAAAAADRYLVIVSGAAGEPQYVQQYAAWCDALVKAFTSRMGIDPAHIDVLSEAADGNHASTAENTRRALIALRQKMRADDLAMVVLIGHGTFDGVDAKFNLVGPDLTSAQWAALLKSVPGRLVLVDTTAASFPFLEAVSGPRRIVITATDSGAQRFDTVFPEYLTRAFADEAADLDKNGRVSIWEAFLSASLGVRRYYEERGQLATERPLLDDNGDGRGREAGAGGTDGAEASRVYFDAETGAPAATDEQLIVLLQKRAALQIDADDLKQRRVLMTPAEYAQEFERLMIEIARTERAIRQRQKT
jgi:hypothetical protein